MEDISFKRLKDLLKEKGVTSKELAEKLGKDAHTISMIVTDKAFPKTDLMARICCELKVSMSEICAFNNIKPNKWFEGKDLLYTPPKDATGEVTYKPLRRFLEIYISEYNEEHEGESKKTDNDFFDKIKSERRNEKAKEAAQKGLAAMFEARGIERKEMGSKRRNAYFANGLTAQTRAKLRQDKSLNIQTIYDICKHMGCTIDYVLSYK